MFRFCVKFRGCSTGKLFIAYDLCMLGSIILPRKQPQVPEKCWDWKTIAFFFMVLFSRPVVSCKYRPMTPLGRGYNPGYQLRKLFVGLIAPFLTIVRAHLAGFLASSPEWPGVAVPHRKVLGVSYHEGLLLPFLDGLSVSFWRVLKESDE